MTLTLDGLIAEADGILRDARAARLRLLRVLDEVERRR